MPVIFDEIHYIDDPERGSVWEESLIFMPDTMRFLGLSATIPNVEQLAEWIGQTQRQEIKIVTHFERIVPLRHYIFEKSMGAVPVNQFRKRAKKVLGRIKQADGYKVPATTHVDLIEENKDGICLVCFSLSAAKKLS